MDQVLELGIDEIAVIDRKRKDLGDIEGLWRDIQEAGGLINPITVRRASPIDRVPESWVLVAGQRRLTAHVIGGADTIRAIDWGSLSALQQRIVELKENLGRKEMTWAEEVELKAEIQRLRSLEASEKGEKWTQKKTAQELGESVANVSKDIQLAEAMEKDPSLRAAPSKRAAVRMLDMKERLARRELKAKYSPVQELRQLMVTAKAEEWLAGIETASQDLFLSDFPYGIDYYKSGQKMRANPNELTSISEYDDSQGVTLDLFVDIVPHAIRVTKESGWLAIMMCDENYDYLRHLVETCCATHFEYFDVWWEQQENGEWLMEVQDKCNHKDGNRLACRRLRAEVPGWIWYRPNSNNPPRYPERHVQNQYERILVVNRGEGRIFKRDIGNVLVHDAEYGNRIHAMQKPLTLGRDIIERLTLPQERIIDPFFGSGNFFAAAAQSTRYFSGCDANPNLLDLAIENVAQHYVGGGAQPQLELIEEGA